MTWQITNEAWFFHLPTLLQRDHRSPANDDDDDEAIA
jgi:hypothetical protein